MQIFQYGFRIFVKNIIVLSIHIGLDIKLHYYVNKMHKIITVCLYKQVSIFF